MDKLNYEFTISTRGCGKGFAMSKNKKLDKINTNIEWVSMKCLIDAQQQTLQAMEHHALSSLTECDELTPRELKASLREARYSHERAIADIDTALEQLNDHLLTDETDSVDGVEQ